MRNAPAISLNSDQQPTLEQWARSRSLLQRLDDRLLHFAGALAIRDRCLNVWAVDAVASIHAYDLEVIVMGGRVMESAEVILPYVQSYVNQYAWTPWGKVQIRAAELGNNAALLGAVPLLSEE